MAYIIGVDEVAKKVKDIAVGADDVAHAVKSAYIGVDGVARKFYQRGKYTKKLYFFGAPSSGDEYITNKLYSVKDDGTEPIEYTLNRSIYAYRTRTNSFLKPPYADWNFIESAKMFYDPDTQRLCVVALDDSGSYVHFNIIDCDKNLLIAQSRTGYRLPDSHTINENVYYSNELGCVFVVNSRTNGDVNFVCYNIRTATLTTKEYNLNTASGYFYVRGLYASKNSNGTARLVLIGADNVWYYQNMQCAIVDWDIANNNITGVSPSGNIPTGLNRVSFIAPHPFLNKNKFNIQGICFVNNNANTGQSTTGYLCGRNGVNSFNIRESAITDRQFGFSNTHGAMWVQGTNGAYLAKYATGYSESVNPTGAIIKNNGRTYTGPVIGGGVITGYTDSNTAIIYANISGSYYNITPSVCGPYNNPICEGINLKEILIPNANKFLVYDFNQAAYTTPISVASVISQFQLSGVCPYVALLSWTKNEQEALVNLGY